MQTLRATDAAPYLEELRSRCPNDPSVRLCWARCQHRLGRLDEARRTLDALLADEPDNAQALGERGVLALHEDDTAQAEPLLAAGPPARAVGGGRGRLPSDSLATPEATRPRMTYGCASACWKIPL